MSQAPMPSHEESHWDPSVISLVAAICIIFLLICYSKLLKQIRYSINGLIFHRNRVQRQRLNEDNADDFSLQFYSHGLESSIIQSLPIAEFNKNKEHEQEPNPNDSECGVCLGEFEEGERLKHLPNCSHAFHVACIDTWFQTHSNCPLCRSNVYDFSFPHECSVSMYTRPETLRREDFFQQRAAHYQVLRDAVLLNPSLRYESTGID